MGLFNKNWEEKQVKAARKKASKDSEDKAKKSMQIAEIYANLGDYKRTFEQTIQVERLNAIERREKRIGDAAQKARIHDAATCLLAIEELEMDLQSAPLSKDLAKAKRKLGFVAFQITRLAPGSSVSRKAIKDQTGFEFDNSTATETYVERAELVDEEFVENLILGFSIEECMKKKLPAENAGMNSFGETDLIGQDPEYNKELVDSILEKNARKR